MKKATVLGAGSFGTAVSQILATNFEEVLLWARDESAVQQINALKENAIYLPGLKLLPPIRATSNLEEALAHSELVAVGIPSQATRDVLSKAKHQMPQGVPVVTVAKGIENHTLCTMTEVLEQTLGPEFHSQIAVLSGPSFAKEMMKKMPTVVTIAAKNEATAKAAQRAFSSEVFRAYTSTDVVGVQVGGALKNVIAIAAGMSDGLGLGHNSRAAIITRGLAEIARIAVKMGGNPLTLAGLSGMGDLVLTCTGELSRNRTVGMQLGQGKSIADILKDMKQVAEGVKTAQSAKDLAIKMQVEMPICEQVHAILYEGKSPKAVVQELMTRTPRSELV
jgi:glycerol-3-phosphate dehydrogenase (NAD(P)+)